MQDGPRAWPVHGCRGPLVRINLAGQGFAAQEVVDAGCERLHPLAGHACKQLIRHVDAERYQDIHLVIVDVRIGRRSGHLKRRSRNSLRRASA